MVDLVDILNKRGIPYKKTNNPYEILLSCPSGLHEDKNASLSYNLERNIFHCWSCDFNGGSSKFLQAIGEEPNIELATKQTYKISKLRKKLDAVMETDNLKLPDDRKVFAEVFRGISPRIYKHFKAFTTNELGLTDYLAIPVYQHGKLKFIEGRLLKDLPNQPKYYRSPAKAKVSDCLFPLDYMPNTNYVILVEGLFDMLNMWQNGFTNTLCIFGSGNFNKKKVTMLDNLGVTRVDIMMDSDKAGQLAAEKITALLDSANIYSRIIQLPPGIDPGELSRQQAEKLLK